MPSAMFNYESMNEGSWAHDTFPLGAPKISVVIRSMGEEKYLRPLIGLLKKQTVRDVEIILVADYSHFETLAKLRRLPIDGFVPIDHDEFSHAYSTNLGVIETHGDLVAITNGHSLPVSDRWLELAARHFSNPKIAGVTGLSTPMQDGSIWEKLYYTPLHIELSRKKWLSPFLELVGPYIFSTTNCMIRRSLWDTYPFDESLPQCEDYDWGKEMCARGYLTVIDPDFSVFHSHGDGIAKLLSRRREWGKVTRTIAKRTRPRSSTTQLSKRNSTSFPRLAAP